MTIGSYVVKGCWYHRLDGRITIILDLGIVGLSLFGYGFHCVISRHRN